MTSQPTSVAKPGSTIPAKPAGSSSSARLSTSPTARRKVSSEIYMAAPPRLPRPVRNVRIDTSLISQFSQAQRTVTTEPEGVSTAGPVVLLGIDHDLHPRLAVPGGRCGSLDWIEPFPTLSAVGVFLGFGAPADLRRQERRRLGARVSPGQSPLA